MSSFHFLRPGWLLLLPFLLALLLWLWRCQLRSRSWQAVCDPALLPHLLLGRSRRRANWPLWLLAAGLLLALLALAGPAWVKQPQPLFRQQSALVLLFDLSRSMAAADLKPSRLERARLKIEDLLRQRREGQTALIAFAGDAFVVTPLTDDVQTINALLKSLTPELLPVQGSEPQRAIRLALELLQQAGLQRGRLLLISDEDRPERVLAAAAAARQAGFELAVLGVGTESGAPIPVAGGGFLKDDQGNMVLPRLNEAGLRQLAAAGGGAYRRLSIDDSDLQGLLNELERHRLDQAETSSGKTGVRWREEGVWLLWPLALLAALAFRRGWLVLAVLLLLPPRPVQAMSWQELWQRPEQRAASAFAAGKYEQAGQLFQDPRWKASALYRAGQYQEAAKILDRPESADDWYNQGNALARSGQLPQALQAYDQALQLNPAHADAKANRELVAAALQQQQQQQEQQNQQDKQDKQDSGEQNRQQPADAADEPQGDAPQPQQPDGDASEQPSAADPAQSPPQGSNPDSAAQQHPGPAEREPAAQPPEPRHPAEPAAAAEPQETAQSAAPTATADAAPSEEERAVQQWLQRIPDDPGGLMRRKFLYQYRQRGRQQETDRPW